MRNGMNGLADASKSAGIESGAAGWRRLFLAGMAALSLAIVLSAPMSSAVHAADDDEEDSVETKFIKKFFGISDGASIDYKERPPLVVPPNLNNLPKPQANAVVNSPNWPKNPEDVERLKRAALQKNQRRKSPEDEARPLTPAELDLGRKQGAGRVAMPTGPQDQEAESRRMLRPDELGTKPGFFSSLFKDNSKINETAKFESEPTRQTLTQPPPGYQTPSAAHPYGVTPGKQVAKPFDLSKRGEYQ